MRISDWSSDVCSSDDPEHLGSGRSAALNRLHDGIDTRNQEQQAEQPANFDIHAHSLPGVDEAARVSPARVLRSYFGYTVMHYFPTIPPPSTHTARPRTSINPASMHALHTTSH